MEVAASHFVSQEASRVVKDLAPGPRLDIRDLACLSEDMLLSGLGVFDGP